ncbi:hypothetical protein CR513_53494, partial [Mucuna pruriens]
MGNTQKRRSNPTRAFSAMPMTYTELLTYLIQNSLAIPFPLKPLQPPCPKNYDLNVKCDYHTDNISHTIEKCWGLNHKMQDLTYATRSYPLPNHGVKSGSQNHLSRDRDRMRHGQPKASWPIEAETETEFESSRPIQPRPRPRPSPSLDSSSTWLTPTQPNQADSDIADSVFVYKIGCLFLTDAKSQLDVDSYEADSMCRLPFIWIRPGKRRPTPLLKFHHTLRLYLRFQDSYASLRASSEFCTSLSSRIFTYPLL